MAIPGANQTTLSLPRVLVSDAGAYDVIVTTPSSVSTSATAQLLVTTFGWPPKITVSGEAGARFEVQSKDDLKELFWATITNAVTGTSPFELFDSATRPQKFYRVIAEP